MFLAEKGLKLDTRDLDIMGAENRKGEYVKKNPGGQIPALELDDGTVIAETVPIFEYFEEQHPNPSLIGKNPKERAEARMWARRIEQKITENLYNGFRYAEGLDLFKDRMRCMPEAAKGLKQNASDGLVWLDGLMGGRQFVAGDRFTIGDIILYCALDFGGGVGQKIPDEAKQVGEWFKRVDSRPSAKASLHPAHEQVGMKG
jgi:glutathione S-transferase